MCLRSLSLSWLAERKQARSRVAGLACTSYDGGAKASAIKVVALVSRRYPSGRLLVGRGAFAASNSAQKCGGQPDERGSGRFGHRALREGASTGA